MEIHHSTEEILKLFESNRKQLLEQMKKSLTDIGKTNKISNKKEFLKRFENKLDEVIDKLKKLKNDDALKLMDINSPINRLYGVFRDRDIS